MLDGKKKKITFDKFIYINILAGFVTARLKGLHLHMGVYVYVYIRIWKGVCTSSEYIPIENKKIPLHSSLVTSYRRIRIV